MMFPQQLSFLDDDPGTFPLNQYQEAAALTDNESESGMSGLSFLLLGLFGEIGSLLSELKKKQRDAESYIAYKRSVVEELGDALWYLAVVAKRASIPLGSLAIRLNRDFHNWDEGNGDLITFTQIQGRDQFEGPSIPNEFEGRVIDLASKVGLLLNDYSVEKITTNCDRLSAHLVDILDALVLAANDADVSLGMAALKNIEKTYDRWPIERVYGEEYDEEFDVDEQLPRLIHMEIQEKDDGDRCYVIQKCNGIIIGNRITDNRTIRDDYRFHDVFHLAYIAILGWSPVMRALFNVKRKSDPAIDQNQDGARAILIEEGVSTWVFNHAMQLDYLFNIKKLDFSLLKTIREFVRGYEVENRPLWQWEHAILEGYRIFRELQRHRRGRVIADMINHTIQFEKLEE